MENKKSPNNKNTLSVYSKKNDVIKAKISFIYELTINITKQKYLLLDLKEQINKLYSIKDDEYDLLIGEKLINDLPNNTDVLPLLDKYKVKTIKIKSFKNTLDIYKGINDYEAILNKNILTKNKDIELINAEYEKLKKDLYNV
jgi:hypothetical protein